MIIEIITSFIGLILGLIIASFTQEELQSGKKYFIWFKKIILIILIITLLYFPINYLASLIAFIIGILVAYFFKKEYFYLGLALTLSSLTSSFLFVTILIFLFGLPYGTLLFKKHKKIILFDLILFLIPLLLLLIKQTILNINYILLAFTAGAFFTLLFKK